jgi:predicted O-methyltransferase YrrM
MSGIIDSKIEDYLKALYRDAGDDVQLEMEALAEARSFPIVGPLVGRTLGVLARAIARTSSARGSSSPAPVSGSASPFTRRRRSPR